MYLAPDVGDGDGSAAVSGLMRRESPVSLPTGVIGPTDGKSGDPALYRAWGIRQAVVPAFSPPHTPSGCCPKPLVLRGKDTEIRTTVLLTTSAEMRKLLSLFPAI